MRLQLTSAPAAEPITADDEKLHARVDIDDDDDLIDLYIKTARLYVEHYIQSALIAQTWKLTYDSCDEPFSKRLINIPMKPITSITSIKTYDSVNAETIFSSDSYRLSGDRVVLNDNYDWPTNYRLHDALEIIFVAGYGASGSYVPEDIKQAIRMLVAQYYQTREALFDPMVAMKSEYFKVPFGVTAILQPYRTFYL
jgi:uncharacterized phiE125 gp8 family phage protein